MAEQSVSVIADATIASVATEICWATPQYIIIGIYLDWSTLNHSSMLLEQTN